jgi:hypothetical protein
MKRWIVTALLQATLLCAAAFAQDAADARDLFVSYAANKAKGRPGVKVRLERLRDGVREFVRRDEEFRSGDKVKLHFAVNFPAYVEIYNWGSSGDFQRLFPFTSQAQRVNPTADYVVPGRATEWFEFDETPGVERLVFVFSAAPMKRIAKPAPRKQTPSGSKPTPGGTASNKPGKPTPANDVQQALDEINARGLGDEESRDLRRVRLKEESYIFCTEQRLQRIVKDVIMLRHR